MYPIDVSSLVRHETLGARANDPTVPHRPRRRLLLLQAFGGPRAAKRRSRPDLTARATKA